MSQANEPRAADAALRAAIIDADGTSARAIGRIASEDGYVVDAFASSDAGLQALAAGDVALIVLDDRTHALGALAWIGLARPLLQRHGASVLVVGRRPEDTPNLPGVTFLERPFSDGDLREALLAARWSRDGAQPLAEGQAPPSPRRMPSSPRPPSGGTSVDPDAAKTEAQDRARALATEDRARPSAGASGAGGLGLASGMVGGEQGQESGQRKRFKSTLSFSPKQVQTVSTSGAALAPTSADRAAATASAATRASRSGPAQESAAGVPGGRTTARHPSGAVVGDDHDPATERQAAVTPQAAAAAVAAMAFQPTRSMSSGAPGRGADFAAPRAQAAPQVGAPQLQPASRHGPPTQPASIAAQPVSAPAEAATPGPVAMPASRPSKSPQIAPARPSDERPRGRRTTVLPDNLVIADRYELRGVLGSGGMAIVYRAHDRELDEDVALKLLKDERGDESSLARFRHELRICRRLQHPAIVQTYEFGVWQGRRFLTMELLDGTDVANLLKKRGAPLDLLEAVQLFAQAARGLDAAHRAGVIHRDVKPHNLFVLADGQRLKIMDFGIAKSEELSMTMTNAEHVLGTPAYLAPERLRDQVELSPSTDLYSLAVAMYQALTCKLPFSGPDVSTLLASILLDTAKPLRSLRPDTPADLDALLLRCLQRDPGSRPPSCGVLAEELDEIARRLRRVLA